MLNELGLVVNLTHPVAFSDLYADHPKKSNESARHSAKIKSSNLNLLLKKLK
jgi:hypothetical protein